MEPALDSIKIERALIHQRLDTTDSLLSLLKTTADELEKRLIPVLTQLEKGQTPYYAEPIQLTPGESPIAQRITAYNNTLGMMIDELKNLNSLLQV